MKDAGDNEGDDVIDEDDPNDGDYTPGNVGKGELKTDVVLPKERAKHSDEEKKIQASQFSVNFIDLLKPPMPIHFGKWNMRPLVPQEWKKLKTSFTTQGIKSLSSEHMMPLVIKRRYVDESCVDNNASGHKAKMLVLSDEGKRELRQLEMAGGRHRMAAVEGIKDEKQKDLKQVMKQREALEKKRVVKEEASEKKKKDLEAYDKRIAKLQGELAGTGQWGVILYDEGK